MNWDDIKSEFIPKLVLVRHKAHGFADKEENLYLEKDEKPTGFTLLFLKNRTKLKLGKSEGALVATFKQNDFKMGDNAALQATEAPSEAVQPGGYRKIKSKRNQKKNKKNNRKSKKSK